MEKGAVDKRFGEEETEPSDGALSQRDGKTGGGGARDDGGGESEALSPGPVI